MAKSEKLSSKKTITKKGAAKKTPRKKNAAKKETSAPGKEQVEKYLSELGHPLQKEIEEVRKIILSASENISERVKWNAPSFYTEVDLVTFNCRPLDKVHLVFHHPSIVKIKSPLLEGEYKDRRMVYFKNMKEVKSSSEELRQIVSELVKLAARKPA